MNDGPTLQQDGVVSRITALSTDELLRVVGPARADYTANAVQAAELELRRRNVPVARSNADALDDAGVPQPGTRRRRVHPLMSVGALIGVGFVLSDVFRATSVVPGGWEVRIKLFLTSPVALGLLAVVIWLSVAIVRSLIESLDGSQ